MVAKAAQLDRDAKQFLPPPGVHFTRKFKEILSFLVDLGHGARAQEFFDLFGIPRPIPNNERIKIMATLSRMEECGLLDRLPVLWHNGTTWILTDLGVACGQQFAAEHRQTLLFLQRKEKALQNDPYRPPTHGGGRTHSNNSDERNKPNTPKTGDMTQCTH